MRASRLLAYAAIGVLSGLLMENRVLAYRQRCARSKQKRVKEQLKAERQRHKINK